MARSSFHPLEEVSEATSHIGECRSQTSFHPLEEVSEVAENCDITGEHSLFPSLRGSFGSGARPMYGRLLTPFPSLSGSFGSPGPGESGYFNQRFHPLEEVSEALRGQGGTEMKIGFHPLEEVSEVREVLGMVVCGPEFPSLRGSFGRGTS